MKRLAVILCLLFTAFSLSATTMNVLILTNTKVCSRNLNGIYGGANGTGGFEAVSPYLNWFEPTISDFRGNILGVVTNGVISWNPGRPTGYGAVPGYRPVALANGANLVNSSAWRGRWGDITGFYNVGLRAYDPVSGRWLSGDPAWNERDPNYYTFAGGDPINGFDKDGRCVEGAGTAVNSLIAGTASLLYNGAGAAEYALASTIAPTWAYNNLGGYAQNFANQVTGAAQFGYNVSATATYGAISPFAPDVAYNNYGGNVQQFMGQAPGLYGGDNQSTAFQIGYAAVNAATLLLGGGESDAGNLGTVGEVSTAEGTGIRALGESGRNTLPLTPEQIQQVYQHVQELGLNPDDFLIHSGPSLYSDMMDKVLIGPDVFPDVQGSSAISQLSPRAVIAHEAGHMISTAGGFSLEAGSIADEVQATMVGRWLPGLTEQDSSLLLQHAQELGH